MTDNQTLAGDAPHMQGETDAMRLVDRDERGAPHVLAFLYRGPISPRLHGTLDYPLAAALIAGPLLLDFDSERAFVLILVLGGAAALLAVGTNWSRGIFHVIPPPLHGILDIGATIVLIIAPFVLSYSEHALALWFSVGVGVGGLVATLCTRFESDLEPSRA